MSGGPSEFDPVEELAEEFVDRYRRGERPSLTEYARRFPEFAGQIRELFPALVVMEELGSIGGSPGGCGTAPRQLGEYRILREVGRGGMGIVYEAVQESLGRHVALKVLPGQGSLNPTQLERFRREAKAAARLHHTNIVPVFGVGQCGGVHYFAMQFIQGQGLDEVLKELRRLRRGKSAATEPGTHPQHDSPVPSVLGPLFHDGDRTAVANGSPEAGGQEAGGEQRASGTDDASPLSPAADSRLPADSSRTELTRQAEGQYFRSVAQIGVQVAEALEYAHSQGVLHRDIKPSNLLLDARGTAWVTDLGLAKAEGADGLTQTGDIVGTLRYMAPERFSGWSDPRSDVYGLGVTLYELLTLRSAFEDGDRARLIDRVLHDDPPRPRKLDGHIPADLETIILKAVAKEPRDRYANAGQLAEDLRRFLTDRTIQARRSSPTERTWRWCRRNPALAALTGSVAVLLLAVTVVSSVAAVWLKREGEAARAAERARTEQLGAASLNEARALRGGGLVGRRFRSLDALRRGADIRRSLGQFDEHALALRNEAIACLALPDLRVGRAWDRQPQWKFGPSFDRTLQRYALADERGAIHVFRTADHEEVERLAGSDEHVVLLDFGPDGRFLAATYDTWQGPGPLVLWDLHRGTSVVTVRRTSYLDAICDFSPDGKWFAVAQQSPAGIDLYELPSGQKRKSLGPPVGRLRFHPDGRRIAVAHRATVSLRDLDGGNEVRSFRHPPDTEVYTLAWRDDGRLLAVGCYNTHVYVWDLATAGPAKQELKGHSGTVVRLGFNHAGDLLASSAWDSTLRLWDPHTGRQLLSLAGAGSEMNRFSPDDRLLDHGADAARTWLWEVAGGQECRQFFGHQKLAGVTVSPDGRLLASCGDDGVRLWDLRAVRDGDKQVAFLDQRRTTAAMFQPRSGAGANDPAYSLLTASAAGLERRAVTADSATGNIVVGSPEVVGWPARAPLPLSAQDTGAWLSPDGRRVAVVPRRGQALAFDLDTPRAKVLVEAPFLTYAAFSPDGRWLATGNRQGAGAKVWDAYTGQLVTTLRLASDTPGEGSAQVGFSPDGRWLVTSTFEEYRFWEVKSWRRAHGLRRENAGKSIGTFVFSPDGAMMATRPSLTEVRLTVPATGRALATLPSPGNPFCFSPDGSRLVTAGEQDTFLVWDLRLIRRQLSELGLDWDLAAFPPEAADGHSAPPRVEVRPAPPILRDAEREAAAVYERGLEYARLHWFTNALADFDRALELDPCRTQAYHDRAYALVQLGRWAKALEDYERVELDEGRWEPWFGRGLAYAAVGQFDQAAADIARAVERPGATEMPWFYHALLRLHFNDAGGYRRACAVLCERFGGTSDPASAGRIAWACVMLPGAEVDLSRVTALAEIAVAGDPGSYAHLLALGACHYRAGRFADAVRRLQEATRRHDRHVMAALFLAMAHQRHGDADEAHRWLAEATRRREPPTGGESGTTGLTWAQQLVLRLLRREAEDLLTAEPKMG